MNRHGCLLLLVSLFLSTQPVQAGSVETKERTARVACLSGDFAKGVAILSELFVDTKDSAYIYNQGRCFEQNSRYAEAIARFQEFLRAGKRVKKSDKDEAQKHIADCQDLLAKQSTPAAAPPATAPTPAPTVAQVPVASVPQVAATPPVVQQTNPRLVGESVAGVRTAGIITATVGGMALITGVILNLKVNGMASDLQKTDGYTPSKESDRKTYQTLGWVGYGVGAACVTAGAVLYFLGHRPDDAGSTSVAILPSFAPGQAGAAFNGAF
jgi:hypothetical protein